MLNIYFTNNFKNLDSNQSDSMMEITSVIGNAKKLKVRVGENGHYRYHNHMFPTTYKELCHTIAEKLGCGAIDYLLLQPDKVSIEDDSDLEHIQSGSMLDVILK